MVPFRGEKERRRLQLNQPLTNVVGAEQVQAIVEISPGATVGAMSFVPKYAKLVGGLVYAGAPAAPIARIRAIDPAPLRGKDSAARG